MNLLFRAALAAVSVQALLAQANPSPGQNTLYILNALTGMGFDFDSSATLYALDSSGQVRLAGSLASGDRQDGVDFVFADYDRRVIVAAAPKTTPARISYLSMDEPSAITQRLFGMPALYDRFSEISTCIIEPTAGQMAVAQMLARILVAPTPEHPRPQMEYRLLATPLTASGEPVALPDSDETDCRSSGYFGTVWDRPPDLSVDVRANTELRVNHTVESKFS